MNLKEKSAPDPTPFVPNPDVRANVSVELRENELQTLINLCAANAEFAIGLQLAERKSNLRANCRRLDKEQQAMAASGSTGQA